MESSRKNTTNGISRRDFISLSAAFCIPVLAKATVSQLREPIRLGLISDLHHDLIHDGKNRLTAFLLDCGRAKVDGIMQLGDFVFPSEKNQNIIDLFNQAHQTSLHVIGNHDTDNGHTKQQCIDRWGMPSRYYTQQVKGIRLIVLDGNDPGSPDHKGGYPAYIGPEQIAWLKAQLGAIKEPIIIVSHQPLIGSLAVDNAAEVQAILASAADRIIVAINGHTHVDSLIYASGIPYLTINSASYFWIGDKFRHESYPREIHEAHQWMSRMCPYQDPLYSVMTIDPATMTIQINREAECLGREVAHRAWVYG